MEMKTFKRIVLIVCVLFFVIACNKDQSAVKMLNGTWELNRYAGIEVPLEQRFTYSFYACKLKQDTYCDFRKTNPNGTSIDLMYRVSQEGKKLELHALSPSGNAPVLFAVRKLNKTNLTLRFENDSISVDYEFIKW